MTDERSDHILDAALPVFGHYGYGKTTMQDIARAAGMSRAALYLHFATKEELFRAGTRRAHARALDQVDAVLAAPGDVVTRVSTAMSTYFGGLMAQISSTAHGGELRDASLTVTGDIVGDAHTALISRLAAALEEAAAAGEVWLSVLDATAEDLARLLLATADGLAKANPDPQVWREQRALFFRLVSAAITTPEGTSPPPPRPPARRRSTSTVSAAARRAER
ncbi:helix-turn-helix transcriptional regulator [Solihabitans fulvus]|uniref:Helix-turn-helix transcriptional regulator n=1 Tax=Solihabitans fulvus TaxID=1892852 RepID=A0A5B2XS44_9PSEU|nr:helix-turn-helix domain-containing protein [Solihabitans fulvus]KAA2265679.1 helix-turn-helix transcriptional regulator [Solihabitans fulvus]